MELREFLTTYHNELKSNMIAYIRDHFGGMQDGDNQIMLAVMDPAKPSYPLDDDTIIGENFKNDHKLACTLNIPELPLLTDQARDMVGDWWLDDWWTRQIAAIRIRDGIKEII